MSKVAFITCTDLGRYFVSQKNASLTHDDQVAADYLSSKGITVKPIVWGEDLSLLKTLQLDAFIVRSPWDYMDSEVKRTAFFNWLSLLKQEGLSLLNPFEILKWNLDKHYLLDLKDAGIAIPPTLFIEKDEPLRLITDALKSWDRVVLKPCISAAAKDTFLITANEWSTFKEEFAFLRKDRVFMVQPFYAGIQEEGEWSCVFLNQQYSHSVLKKPKKGHWLVQDELGGSVQSLEPPAAILAFAKECFLRLKECLSRKLGVAPFLLYARVDIMPGLVLGELELVEPELFFLDRNSHRPNENALKKFYKGITYFIKEQSGITKLR